jgi:hypothetical protein
MGWASASEIFDPVARALVDCGAPDDTKRKVLGDLIRRLRDNDWDTEDESLAEFADDPAIVAAFRDNDVILRCGDECGPDVYEPCEEERGHDSDHKDDLGRTWPRHPKES